MKIYTLTTDALSTVYASNDIEVLTPLTRQHGGTVSQIELIFSEPLTEIQAIMSHAHRGNYFTPDHLPALRELLRLTEQCMAEVSPPNSLRQEKLITLRLADIPNFDADNTYVFEVAGLTYSGIRPSKIGEEFVTFDLHQDDAALTAHVSQIVTVEKQS